MQKRLLPVVCILAIAVPAAFASVSVSAPGNGATVQSPVHFVASASTSCSKGVASMGIYTAPNQLAYTVNGAKLDTSLALASGKYATVVEEWDYCGGATTTPVSITVSGSSGVQVSTPANNSTVGSPVNFQATASSTCRSGTTAADRRQPQSLSRWARAAAKSSPAFRTGGAGTAILCCLQVTVFAIPAARTDPRLPGGRNRE